MDTLSTILDQDLLRELAGDRYFLRGVDYCDRGLVQSLAQYDNRITAEVAGSDTYQVSLWVDENQFFSRCTCPLGIDEIFCKHCVAVGLAWIAEPPPYRPAHEAPASKGTTMADVRTYLSQQSHDTLVNIILNQAKEDDRLRQTLLMKAATKQPDGVDIETFRRSLYDAIIPDGFISYYESSSYADKVSTIEKSLGDLLDQGYTDEVIDLCEEAISLIDDAFNSIDDSNGYVGDVAEDIENLHYLACDQGTPDLHNLADSLLTLELNSGYGYFSSAAERYADILGKEGLAIYGQLVDAELAFLVERGSSEEGKVDYRLTRVRRIKENLVSKSGSVEDLVNVIAGDLSQPSRYFQIVQIYKTNGQMEKAIAWAEDGLNAFVDSYRSDNLGNFLIEAYEGQDRFADALTIVWRKFDQHPSLSRYQRLHQQAEKMDAWAEWRVKAIERVRQTMKSQPQATHYTKMSRNRFYGPDGMIGYSLLVEILLWEEDAEQAWEEANTGGCNASLWMQLAAAREQSHPEDAIKIYQPQIEPLLNQSNNRAYQQAVDLVIKIQTVMVQGDRQAEFDAYLAELCKSYKRKRNFIKYLKQQGLKIQ